MPGGVIGLDCESSGGLMKRTMLQMLLGFSVVSAASAEPATEWKDVNDSLVGVHLRVKRSWTEADLRETPDTGSITFQISADPHITITAQREKADYPFDVWVSSEILTQLFEPGYTRQSRVLFAGRSSVLVIGTAKDKEARIEQTYFSSKPPFIDQITFSAPKDAWSNAQTQFASMREGIHWNR